MNNEIDKSDLEKLVKPLQASCIPLKQPTVETVKIIPDINTIGYDVWGNKSNQLLSSYKYGESLAKYGVNELTTISFFKRLSTAICSIITDEMQKGGSSAEQLKPYYNILESCMVLLAKEIEKKVLKDYNISSIIASLQGFIINYNQTKGR
jgi:hypothetical protein